MTRKFIFILGFITALFIIPKSSLALSETCTPGARCVNVGQDYYAGDCRPRIAALANCGTAPAGRYYSFSCSEGCFLRTTPTPNPCPGGIMIASECKTIVNVIKDGVGGLFKIWDGAILSRLVYLSDDNCTANQVAKWNGNRWACAADDTGSGGGTSGSQWTTSGSNASNIYYNPTNGKVGIGTATPIAPLDVSGAARFGWHTPTSETTIGSYSFASGAALAGGMYSTAMGATIAKSDFSTAIGSSISVGTTATDANYSVGIGLGGSTPYTLAQPRTMAIMGGKVGIGTVTPITPLDVSGSARFGTRPTGTETIGDNSFASGYQTTASAPYSTALGRNTTASQYDATAMGRDTIASNFEATAMGYRTTASGNYSTAMGFLTTATMAASTAMGSGTTASGSASTAMGSGTIAFGDYSTSMGSNIIVNGSGSFGIGLNPSISTPYDIPATQPNTMAIMGGKVGIGTTAPVAFLDARGSVHFGSIPSSFGVGSVPAPSIGINSLAAGTNSYASGNSALAFGNIHVSGDNSFGVGMDNRPLVPPILSQPNTMAIIGGKVGIGTTTPFAALDVRLRSNDTNVSGGNAIRSGLSTSSTAVAPYNEVGVADIGINSVALGAVTKASGEASVALGMFTRASAIAATAIGNFAQATADYSTAMGSKITVNGVGSFGIGLDSSLDPSNAFTIPATQPNTMAIMGGRVGIGTTTPIATLDVRGAVRFGSPAAGAQQIGDFSFAAGRYTQATGTAAFASGGASSAVGDFAFASGDQTVAGDHAFASGYRTNALNYGTAMGYNTNASGYASTAIGFNTIASGNYSVAMGTRTTAAASYSTAMGQEIDLDSRAINSFGIGLDGVPRTLAQPSTMAIMGGRVGIGTTSPTSKLDVQGAGGGIISLNKDADAPGETDIHFGGSGRIAGENSIFRIGAKGTNLTLATGTNATDDRVVITNNGNVGIGTTPTVKLDVNGDTKITGNLLISGRISGNNIFTISPEYSTRAVYRVANLAPVTMASVTDGICFLTRVHLTQPEDDNDQECIIDQYNGHWRLLSGSYNEGTVECRARCLNWSE